MVKDRREGRGRWEGKGGWRTGWPWAAQSDSPALQNDSTGTDALACTVPTGRSWLRSWPVWTACDLNCVIGREVCGT